MADKNPIQPGLENLQGWGIHNISGQLVPVSYWKIEKNRKIESIRIKEESEKKRKTQGKMFSFLFVSRQSSAAGQGIPRAPQSPGQPGGRCFSTMASARHTPSGAAGLPSSGDPLRHRGNTSSASPQKSTQPWLF